MKPGIVASCAAVVFLTGCAALLNVENPEYSLREVDPRVSLAVPISDSRIDFDVIVRIDNPNRIALNLDRLDFDLRVNGMPILDGTSSENVRIPARGTGDLHLRARIGYREIQSLFRELVDVVRGEQAQYELRGRVYYRTPIGRLDFPFTVRRIL